MRTSWLVLPVIGLSLSASASGQRAVPPAGGEVSVQGRLLDAASPDVPVRRAAIVVESGGRAGPPAFADADGWFELRVRASSPYTLSVTKAGYVPAVLPLRAPAFAGSLEVRLARGGVIAGTVVDSAGRAVVGASVMARLLDAGGAPTETFLLTSSDDRGDYRFASLAAGQYAVSTVRGGGGMENALAAFDETMAARLRVLQDKLLSSSVAMSEVATVELAPGQETSLTIVHREPAVILPYAKVGGAVTGIIRDAAGEPVEGARVQLWRVRQAGARAVVQPVLSPEVTDDRGRYRLYHVPAGRYVIGAVPPRPPGNDVLSFVPDYYPGRVQVADAVPVRVEPAQELAGMDFDVSHTAGARVFGTAVPSRPGVQAATVRLAARFRAGVTALPPRAAQVSDTGEFEFRDVAPGEYVVQLSAGQPEPREIRLSNPGLAGASVQVIRNFTVLHPTERGVEFVTVAGGDAGPLLVRTAPTATMRGRIEIEGAAPGALAEMPLVAVAADPDIVTESGATARIGEFSIKDDGTFEVTGLFGPTRILMPPVQSGWWIRSVDVRGSNAAVDAVDVGTRGGVIDGVTVVLANSAATVTGTVTDERGNRSDEYWAVVFATDFSRWFAGSAYVRTSYAGGGGRFTIAALPPGEYWVAAVDTLDGDSETGEWQNPEFLGRLAPVARRVTVSERERATVEVRLVRDQP